MPNLDKTGPEGKGAGTGRGMGSCCNRAGLGLRRGFGCRRFSTDKEEPELLKEDAEILERELKAVKERIAEIESK